MVSYQIAEILSQQDYIFLKLSNRGADDLTILGFEAFMFFKSGQYKEAAETYARAFKLRPSTALLNNMAFSYWRLGDLGKAENALNEHVGYCS